MASEEGQVIACHTVETWNEQFEKANDSKTLLLGVDHACRFISPFFADLAKKLPSVVFLKVDIDELKAMPTFMFLKEGKILEKVVGAKKDDLQSTIANHLV